MRSIDQKLGRLWFRVWAVFAFFGATASIVFGLVVIFTAPIPGIFLLLLGGFFVWLGRRAWRDRSTLSEALNRDYQGETNPEPLNHQRIRKD